MAQVKKVSAVSSKTNPEGSSAAFFAGGPGAATPASTAQAEPPMVDTGGEEQTASPEPVPTAPVVATQAAPPPPAPVVPPKPAPAVAEPFTLLWSRETANEMSGDGRTVTKYGDKRSLRAAEIKGVGCLVKMAWVQNNGTIAESMCFVPGVVIKNGMLVAV